MKLTLKSQKTRWQKINDAILVLHIVFPVWLMALMLTSAISGTLLLVAVGSALLLGIVYKVVRTWQKGRWVLLVARILAIGACIVFYLPMVVLLNFSESKLLYPLKRLDYTRGVYGDNAPYYERLLPEKLPEQCEDYMFITQGSMVAQDYHPSSYLMFHTDTTTLGAYAAHYEELGCTRLENEPAYESEYEYEDAPENTPEQKKIDWFCGQMRLRNYFQDNLDHAVLYWLNDRYPKGMLLNYETGLVAILT